MAQDAGGPSSRFETTGRTAPPLVAFDFDGTLTVRDSFTAFLRWRTGPARYALGLAKLSPAAVAYLIHRDRGRIKAAAAREFLAGAPRRELEAEARAFAESQAPALFRPDALATWEDWRRKGATLVIVSASPALVVRPFAEMLGADELLATELAYGADDRVTGVFSTPNCRGPEKVVRLEARFGPGVRLAAAYGDTGGDREMLQIADSPGFRVFTARPPEA